MTDKVKCETHGVQQATYVCQHIVPADSDQERPDAWCSECEDARRRQKDGDWTDEVMKLVDVKVLCAACYDFAKSIWRRGYKQTQ